MDHRATAAESFTPFGLVTMASDFGQRDGYVGAMKGVMLAVEPLLRLCDIGHDVPPQSVIAAAMMLRDACPYFPVGTVHLAVIDPGVGTERDALVAIAGGQAFVGPDNGIFSLAWQELGGLQGAWRIDLHEYLLPDRSLTFHGRDVFAPTAAAVAAGLLEPQHAGDPADPVRLVLPMVVFRAGRARGEILYCDRFGNAVTNIDRRLVDQIGRPAHVRLGSVRDVPVHRTYGDVAPGTPVALVGSAGQLEVAVREGSAAAKLGLEAGMPLELVAGPGH